MKVSNRRNPARKTGRKQYRVVAYGVHRREPDFSRLTSTLLDSYLRAKAETAPATSTAKEVDDGAA